MRRRNGQGGGRVRVSALCLLAVVSSLTVSMAAYAAEKDDDDEPKSDAWTNKMTDSVKDAIMGARQKIGLGKAPPPPVSEVASGCPSIAILPGTEAQRVMAPGDTSNLGLRYQYSIMNVGRECGVAGDRVTIKVGADGRVLLGPAGAAGHFDVPIRVAVFNQAQQKAVESRLFKVPVNVAAGQSSSPFDFVSDGITVAIPHGRAGEYSIKVGIDPGKGAGEAPAKVRHARKHKASAEQSASR